MEHIVLKLGEGTVEASRDGAAIYTSRPVNQAELDEIIEALNSQFAKNADRYYVSDH